jgi:hypothetical protein
MRMMNDVEYIPVNEIEVVLKDRFGKKDINELLSSRRTIAQKESRV